MLAFALLALKALTAWLLAGSIVAPVLGRAIWLMGDAGEDAASEDAERNRLAAGPFSQAPFHLTSASSGEQRNRD